MRHQLKHIRKATIRKRKKKKKRRENSVCKDVEKLEPCRLTVGL